MKKSLIATAALFLTLTELTQGQQLPDDAQRLFYLSCDSGLTADVHQGKGDPNFVSSITLIDDGARGAAFRCGEGQLLTYMAPGNIYAQRGTLSLWWRSGMELTDTEFPIWRVAYADHSSWDMVWMRIDYNGQGFDAFVTDNGLSRVRVSWHAPLPLDPDHWYHLTFTWDENEGVQLWVDDEMVAEKRQTAVLDTGLDQMGPHSRIISPYQVQTAYNCIRGGDIDEVTVYETSLFDDHSQASAQRIHNEKLAAWRHRHGFDNAQKAPLLTQGTTTIRKVQIQKAYDEKRWYWKGCDGILETTWPGVYNRSRLTGRYDYIQLPDWDCYSTSGRQLRLLMPDEEWNQVELTGSAYGTLGVGADTTGLDAQTLAHIDQGTHHSIVRLEQPIAGQTLTFTNQQQEEPIQEIDAYYIHEGEAPEGICTLSYRVSAFQDFNHPMLREMEDYIDGRHPEGERQKLLALPENKTPNKTSFTGTSPLKGTLEVNEQRLDNGETQQLPLFHLIVPNDVRDLTDYQPATLSGAKARTGDTGLATITRSLNYGWRYMQGGLDGILLELPALKGTDDELQLNLQVKDPLWPLRNMMNVTVSLRPGESQRLWLDTRDRILPNDRPLYLTLALSDPTIGIEQLAGTTLQLIFKPLDEARKEHVADRLTQIIDSHAMLVEEGTSSRKLSKYTQLERDMEDLLRVDPDNTLGRKYWYHYNSEQAKPAFTAPEIPTSIPAWAYLQLQVLREYRELLEWYIDNRQIENGEFGGGLSDDTDLGNLFPGLIHSGCMPEKATQSLHQMLEAIYDQGMLERGMSTLMTDGLHTYEEGTNTIVQCNIVEPGNPQQVERLMDAARSVRDWLLGRNEAGHLHFRTDYFSVQRRAERGPWTWSSPREFLHLAPACLLGEFYGNEDARRYVLEFADALLAHSVTEADGEVRMPVEINYLSDEVRRWGTFFSAPVLWYSYRWTGDERYLRPLLTTSTYRLYATPLTTDEVERQNLALLRNISDRRFMMREGSVWIDRVYFSCDEIQRQRLGGIALNRGSNFVPGNAVSWRFDSPDQAEKVAVLIPRATDHGMEIICWNTDSRPAEVELTGMEVQNGTWTVNGKRLEWGRNRTIKLTLPAGKEYRIQLELQGEGTDGSKYCDLAIGQGDVSLTADGTAIRIVLHNLGSKEAPASTVALMDRRGKVIASTMAEALAAPTDLQPSTCVIDLPIPAGTTLDKARIVIDPKDLIREVWERNNSIDFGQ